jgi:hypothetical protein
MGQRDGDKGICRFDSGLDFGDKTLGRRKGRVIAEEGGSGRWAGEMSAAVVIIIMSCGPLNGLPDSVQGFQQPRFRRRNASLDIELDAILVRGTEDTLAPSVGRPRVHVCRGLHVLFASILRVSLGSFSQRDILTFL